MPEKEREHQKRANIPSNRIFGLKLEKGKEEGNGKKYHCKGKKLWQADGSDIRGCVGGPLRPIHIVSCSQRRQITISI